MTPSGGKVIHRVSRKRHLCTPPGLRQRIKLDLDYGSVWECDCGKRWKWSFSWADSSWESVDD